MFRREKRVKKDFISRLTIIQKSGKGFGVNRKKIGNSISAIKVNFPLVVNGKFIKRKNNKETNSYLFVSEKWFEEILKNDFMSLSYKNILIYIKICVFTFYIKTK